MAQYFGYVPVARRDRFNFHDDDIRDEWREIREYLRITYNRRMQYTNDQIAHAMAVVRARREGRDWRLARRLEAAFDNVMDAIRQEAAAPDTPDNREARRRMRRRTAPIPMVDLTCLEDTPL